METKILGKSLSSLGKNPRYAHILQNDMWLFSFKLQNTFAISPKKSQFKSYTEYFFSERIFMASF